MGGREADRPRAARRSTGFWAAVIACSLVAARGAGAAAGAGTSEVAGVRFPDAIQVADRTLQLNGMGLRTWGYFFHVYVAGLYLEHPARTPEAVLATDEVRQIRLSMVRGLDHSDIASAIEEGFEKNSKSALPALQPRLDRLGAMFPDVVAGDEIELTYVPGAGTTVTARGTAKGVIEGKDFADALFAVWLGPDPVQDGLKQALLHGGPPSP